MPEPKIKVSVCFAVPVDSASNTKAVKAAYKDIGSQIIRFAEAIKIDPNIIMSHSVVSDNPKDMSAVSNNLADPKMAELQTINKKIGDGLSSLDQPKNQSATELPTESDEDTEFDPPRVKAVTDWKPITSNPAKLAPEKPVATVTPASSLPPIDVTLLADTLLSKFDRVTAKSTAIVKCFVDKRDTDLTIDDIATASGLEKGAVNMWLSGSGKAIKAIENIKRGVYRFDSSKVKVKP